MSIVNAYQQIQSLKNDINGLTQAGKTEMFFAGLIAKYDKSKLSAISTVAKLTFMPMVILPAFGYTMYNHSHFLLSRPNLINKTCLLSMAFIGIAAYEIAKKEVIQTVVHGYYNRVSNIVEKHVGSKLEQKEKDLIIEKTSRILALDPNQNIEDVVVPIITKVAMRLI